MNANIMTNSTSLEIISMSSDHEGWIKTKSASISCKSGDLTNAIEKAKTFDDLDFGDKYSVI